MQPFEDIPLEKPLLDDNRPWYTLLSRYHWFVLIVAALGWLFDTMDQQLFNLARKPAMTELLSKVVDGQIVQPSKEDVTFYSGVTTAIFLLGWATGGMFFGILGDRVGRAKVMLWTILLYSFCTGLSALSTNIWDFSFYRFITGLGVGGEFAVGVALVAEVMPSKARPFALGLLQALSAIGNITAALINMTMGFIEGEGHLQNLKVFGIQLTAWRLMFVVGTLPALLAILIRRNLKEPEQWQKQAKSRQGNPFSSFGELLGDPRWRYNALVGLGIGFAGVVGLWGIGFFSFDLFSGVLRKKFDALELPPAVINGKIAFWVGITSICQNIGGFFGVYAFSYLSYFLGRKPAFALAFIAAMASTAYTFAYLEEFSQIFWMIPLMGFCQLSLFGGFAIYFPELFPTRLRSTGTSFCYNGGRFIAALGPLTLGYLTREVFSSANGYGNEGMRWAGVTMCSVFILGLLILPFAPETKGKELPE